MSRRLYSIVSIAAVGAFGLMTAPTAFSQSSSGTVSFYKEVKPILRKRCQGCHQPALQGGKLVLTNYAAFKAGGGSGVSFKPGHPEESAIMRFITGDPPSMPKNQKPLAAAEVELIRKWIAQGAKDDTPTVKDPIDAQHPPVYNAPPVISSVAYSPDGKYLAVSGFHEVVIHKADGSGMVARLVGRSHRIESLAYSPDGKLLAAVGGDPAVFGEVQFWDTETNTLKASAELGYDSLFGCSFSPDGKRLACGGADNSVRILSVPDGKLLVKFDNHSDWVFATAWTKTTEAEKAGARAAQAAGQTTNRPPIPEDTQHILSTGRDQAIKLLLADTGSFVDDINPHTTAFRCMARRPTANQVLVAGDDGIPRLYQVFRTKARTMNQEDHNLLKTYEKLPAQVNAVAFAPDGARFAIAGEGGQIRLYGTDDAKLLATITGIDGSIFTLAFRPDGKQFAAGGLDGRIRLYDAINGTLVKAFVPVPVAKSAAALH